MLRTYIALLAVGVVAIALSILQRGIHGILFRKSAGRQPDPPVPWVHLLFSDLVFYSLLPGVAYVFFSPYMPFMGFRAGLALGLIGVLVGVLPLTARELLVQDRRTVVTLFTTFFTVIKVLVCLGLLGAIFPL